MASLSSPESRIKAAVQPGIKNQTRCAGRNQESRISRGGQLHLAVARHLLCSRVSAPLPCIWRSPSVHHLGGQACARLLGFTEWSALLLDLDLASPPTAPRVLDQWRLLRVRSIVRRRRMRSFGAWGGLSNLRRAPAPLLATPPTPHASATSQMAASSSCAEYCGEVREAPRRACSRKQARASGGARAQIAAGRSMARVRFISSGGYPARLAPSVYATIG